MNSLESLFLLFVVTPHSISLGLCEDISFSICWMSKENVLERHNVNIWVNITSLKLVGTAGKVTSLTVPPLVENKLSLQFGGSVLEWILTIVPRTKFTKITGRQKPQPHPSNSTRDFLASLSPSEVFACERGTLFFHQEQHFFLAVGHTARLPVRLESRSPSMLLLSWLGGGLEGGARGGPEGGPDATSRHTVTLYHSELGSFILRSSDRTALSHHRLSALDACSRYVACVELAGRRSFTCLWTLTDPDVPQHFQVTSWNSSGVSLAWECPTNHKYSLFLLTAFHLNGSDHVTEETAVWLRDGQFAFSLLELQPCSRVKFGLQTVCQAGAESRYSSMVLSDGNSFHSDIRALHQTAAGPDNYTLSWAVGNSSSISVFQVYHQGALQGTTLTTSFTVTGLLPCQRYQARVVALCGHSVVMSSKTVAAHTGPRGVSDLRYRSVDSTALWTPGSPPHAAVAFAYQLTPEGGASARSSWLGGGGLRLPGLEEGRSYILEVWEQCGERWRSEASQLTFQAANRTRQRARAAGSSWDSDIPGDSAPLGLVLVVPWSLPEELQDDSSEPAAEVKTILKDELQKMLEGLTPPARVELVTFQPADESNRTQIVFVSFDASERDADVLLPVDDQLLHIHSLSGADVSVKDGVIYWEGPDLCSSRRTLCPAHSLCINTLGSSSCVCRQTFYDVSDAIEPPAASPPVCKEKGLFSQCLNKLMTGGISRSYLSSYVGGDVEVKLNDGRCAVNQSDSLLFFHASRRTSVCGTQRQVNQSHITFQNTLTVSLTADRTISRRDLKVVWRCVYPRHYVRNAHVSVDMEWLSSISLVEFNSTLQLGLSMKLFKDQSFTSSYSGAAALAHDDTLFFQVELQTDDSFASDVLLQVEGCWATESPDPQDTLQGVLLQDRCPVDSTFQWLSVNGEQQSSRFSVQMFSLPQKLPLYFHCLANVCGHQEACTQDCSTTSSTSGGGERRSRRSAGRRGSVVSAGPLVVTTRPKSVRPAGWTEHVTMASMLAGSVGFLSVAVLSVGAAKAVVQYYERPLVAKGL